MWEVRKGTCLFFLLTDYKKQFSVKTSAWNGLPPCLLEVAPGAWNISSRLDNITEYVQCTGF